MTKVSRAGIEACPNAEADLVTGLLVSDGVETGALLKHDVEVRLWIGFRPKISLAPSSANIHTSSCLTPLKG